MKAKMTAYPILIFMQSLIKFPVIQIKRAKRDILSYLLSCILTDQPSHRVSYKLTKKGGAVGIWHFIHLSAHIMNHKLINDRYNALFLSIIIIRDVPDTDLAGYPANNFAGYRISGLIVNIDFFSSIFSSSIFCFQKNLSTFIIAISISFYTHLKGSEISLLI